MLSSSHLLRAETIAQLFDGAGPEVQISHPWGPMRKSATVAVVLLGLAMGCSADKSPTAPQAGGLNLTGTWNGPIVVDTNEARMSWNLTQVNAVVSGPVLVLLPNGIVLLNGFLNGTLAGMSLTYTISVGNGGGAAPPPPRRPAHPPAARAPAAPAP